MPHEGLMRHSSPRSGVRDAQRSRFARRDKRDSAGLMPAPCCAMAGSSNSDNNAIAISFFKSIMD